MCQSVFADWAMLGGERGLAHAEGLNSVFVHQVLLPGIMITSKQIALQGHLLWLRL